MQQTNSVEIPDFPTFERLHQDMEHRYKEIETFRKSLLGKYRKRAGIWSSIIALVVFGACLVFEASIIAAVIAALIVFFIVWTIVMNKPRREYRVRYKDEIIGEFVNKLLNGGRYNPSDGISQNVFCNCGLFSKIPDRYSCEDLISGNIGKTEISFSEVHAEEKYYVTDSKGRRKERWRDIFRGIIFIADFNKDFNGHTKVQRNTWIKTGSKKNRVRLEDPVFEKIFDVYSTDQIEARYIITPSLMSRLVELDKKFKNKGLELSFLSSGVYIAVRDNVNYFEGSLSRRADDSKILQREYDMISSFTGIVRDMNLNLRIWGK